MTDSNVKKWYVVRAVSGQENKVKAYIETEIARLGMDDYISQVLVPTEKVVTVRDGKKISKDRVYFPGYVMIEANLTGEIPLLAIPGQFINIVRAQDVAAVHEGPAILGPDVVDILRRGAHSGCLVVS